MTEPTQHQHIDVVDVDSLVISAQTSTAAHIGAVLVAPDDATAEQKDFVFANRTEAPGVRANEATAEHAPWLEVTLSAVPHAVTAVRVIVALDNPHQSFMVPPTLEVTDGWDNTLYNSGFPGVQDMSTLAAIDIERDATGWRISTFGRGYAGGFAAVLAEHQVRIGAPATSRPQLEATPLTMGQTLGLAPGQAVRLQTDTGESLDLVRLGLGWDPMPGATYAADTATHADLDAAALLFAHDHRLLDAVYFDQLTSNDGSTRHLGDSMTGHGRGENEVIAVDLSRIHAQVATVVLIVTSYNGHNFDTVRNAFCRLVDGSSDSVLAHLDLNGGGQHTGMVMAKLYLAATGWKLQAIGEPLAATHPGEAVPHLTHHLA